MPPEGWEHVRRVLAIRLDNIGDVIMLGPALRALKHGLPDASLTLMASPAGSQVAPLLPWVDALIVERVLWQDISGALRQDPARELALADQLRAGEFDAAVIFTSFGQSPYPPAFICYLAGIPMRIGQSKEFAGGLLTQWVRPQPDHGHQVDRNLYLVEQAGFERAGQHLELQVPPGAQVAADRLLEAGGVDPQLPVIVLAPGASCQARRYDLERMAAVGRQLWRETGLPLVLVGSQREAEHFSPLLAALQQEPGPRLLSLVGRTAIPELAGIIRRAGLVVCNNSGPMHMTDALRRPLVVLYSGTELESQWQPRGAPVRLLRRPTDCSPCYRFCCPYHMQCLDIPAEEVVEAALQLLAARPQQQAMLQTSL